MVQPARPYVRWTSGQGWEPAVGLAFAAEEGRKMKTRLSCTFSFFCLWNYKKTVIAHLWKDLGALQKWSECSLRVLWMFSECSLNVLWAFSACSLRDPWVISQWSQCSLSVCKCSLSLLCVALIRYDHVIAIWCKYCDIAGSIEAHLNLRKIKVAIF